MSALITIISIAMIDVLVVKTFFEGAEPWCLGRTAASQIPPRSRSGAMSTSDAAGWPPRPAPVRRNSDALIHLVAGVPLGRSTGSSEALPPQRCSRAPCRRSGGQGVLGGARLPHCIAKQPAATLAHCSRMAPRTLQ